MVRMRPPLTVPFLVFALAASFGCTKLEKLVTKKSGEDPAVEPTLPQRPVDEAPVEAKSSEGGVVVVRVELRPDGLLLGLAGVPPGALLECDLDARPLVPCHDGALFSRPEAGDHKINLIALVNGQKVAFGASATFTVEPQNQAGPDGEVKSPLALEVSDPAFANGQIVKMTEDFTARFRFADDAAARALGCEPSLKCSYDSRTSPFWTACDAGSGSFTVDKDLLALGVQYLSVQARCAEHVGPILTMFFWGVPAGYEPMKLRAITDGEGRHVVSLIKADDCPDKQSYECSEAADDPFGACVNGNSVDNPPKGFRIRMSCGGKPGPALDLNP